VHKDDYFDKMIVSCSYYYFMVTLQLAYNHRKINVQ